MPLALGACVALAAASLLVLPAAPAYDAWAWIVWGREVAGLELDTSGGPSWKPLPVMVTTVLSLAGGAAPELWLLVARASALAALVLAFDLAARLVPREARGAAALAGAVAVVGLVLAPGPEARLLRHAAQGLSEPLLVALVLGAVQRHLAGRDGVAFACGLGAALLRPEAWPALALYGLWLWRARPEWRGRLLAAAGAVVALWLGGDLWGSGDPLTGAARARQPDVPAGEALADAAQVVVAPVWAGAAATVGLALWGARRHGGGAGARQDPVPVLGAGALGWVALVCAMALALDYAAAPRFFLPAGALLAVLAGAGAGRLWSAAAAAPAGRRGRLVAALCAALAVAAPFAVVRAGALPREHDVLRVRGGVQEDLRAALAAAGSDAALRGCGRLAADGRGTALEGPPLMAWELDVALGAVGEDLEGAAGVMAVRVDRPSAKLLAAMRPRARRLVRVGNWRIYAVDCAGRVAR